jgi:CheY-like chemotaxis protein
VRQSRGHIKLYSEVGVGTTVRMYLPRYVGETTDPVVTPATEPEVPVSSGGETVLLVEDEELVMRYAREQLGTLGYRVITARSGAEAIRLLDTRPDIDVLFTDVGLPGGIGGKQVAEAARASRPDLPVLFTSGFPEEGIVHHGRLDAGVSLLRKPYRRVELAARLKQVLSTPAGMGEGKDT